MNRVPGPAEQVVVVGAGLRTIDHHAGDCGDRRTGSQDAECGAEERRGREVVDRHEVLCDVVTDLLGRAESHRPERYDDGVQSPEGS
ncbi:hypothetical protein OOK09_23990 [Streptomyces sp. NBC_00059]|nr:hypothetical protein [Streptomyces sp. NBC_00059]MCX5414939.1 hypothetical protein [Streptomyces sp. NBC_00059]